ncbi:T9SS type A sorting domain-containing protein [Flavobacterium tibetense]|uniref:Fibronectin type-III domain-containing protein n=1 Tax=Flavobacterium tibetense TaxID=2233533 RepID=A0A365P0Y6_9FLAO|nr:T9SS type A sorting domain-containing protein [Flavobacterium tibetense]RBA28139.1 hypothetical protein DPN68_08270 [Flavobacterium tibetense]
MKKITFMILAIFSFAFINAQVNGYVFTQTAGTFTPITGGTVLVTPASDDAQYSVVLPTAFTFNGVPYTDVRVSSNGFLTFGTTNPGTTNYTPLSSTTAYGGAVAGYGRDLNSAGAGSEIRWEQVGDEIVFQWLNVRRYNVTGEQMNFQIRLNTVNSEVKVVYGVVVAGSNTTYPQVGLRGATNADFNNRTVVAATGDWINSTAGAANTSTCYINSANSATIPSNGLTYTWALPSCPAPTNVVVSNVTTTTADFSWTAGGTEFDWEYLILPAGSPAPTGSGNDIDADSFTESGLSPATAYAFWIRAYCSFSDQSNWVGPFNFTTPCDSFNTFPFTETFEVASPSRTCWSNLQVAGAANWTYATGSSGGLITTAFEGTLNARFVSVSGTNTPITKLVSPVFDMSTLTNPRLKFHYAQEVWFGTQNELKVYYRVSSTDPWVEIAHYTTNVTAWTEVILTLPNPSATYQIAFEGINNWGRANVVDNVIVEESPLCVEPTALNVSGITASSAILGWTETGSATSWDIEWGTLGFTPTGTPTISGATNPQAISGLSSNTAYSFYVRANCGANGFSTWVGPFNFTTNIEVVCGTPVNTTHCYTNNDATTWTFTSDDASPLRITFNAGGMEACCDEIIIYDGTDATGTILYQGNNGGNLAGLTVDSTTDSIHIVIDADGSVSCGSGSTCCTAQFDFTVTCATCVNPTATFTSVPDCVNSEFSIDVNLTNLGSATSVSISDGTTTLTNISTTGIQTFGPYTDASNVTIVITNEQDGACTINSGNITNICPPTNDTCATAIPVDCSDVVVGSTSNGATDTGNNASADVWYSYSGAAGNITASLCTNTSFDTIIRVFDSCGGTQIAVNDDSCGLQSSVTFAANGTSTYYIMVEGFGTATGNFELTVSCVLNANSFDNNNFMVYPNPVKDVLNLSYTSEISTVRVMNMLGQEVISRRLNAANAQVDMSQLSAGTYIVNVTIGDTVKTIKVVKQ